jgi:hypothetical protein
MSRAAAQTSAKSIDFERITEDTDLIWLPPSPGVRGIVNFRQMLEIQMRVYLRSRDI